MSLQIEHIPSDYYNSKATIGSLFLFIGYMTKPDIHRDKSYIECKTHVKKMFPDVDENSEGIHIGIIGMMGLKDGPFYNSHKMRGGSGKHKFRTNYTKSSGKTGGKRSTNKRNQR